MPPRITVPGKLINGSAGRVHITRYPGGFALELAHAAQADYLEHCERVGSTRNPALLIAEQPLPLPPVEVRKFWRETTVTPGFEAVGLLMTGVMGLMAATVTHLGEQVVSVLGVHFRSFKNAADAAEWLSNVADCGVDEIELLDIIEAVAAVDPNGPEGS